MPSCENLATKEELRTLDVKIRQVEGLLNNKLDKQEKPAIVQASATMADGLLQPKLAYLDGKVNALQALVVTLKLAMTFFEFELKSLKGIVQTLQSLVTTVSSAIANIWTAIGKYGANANNLFARIDALEARVKALEHFAYDVLLGQIAGLRIELKTL